MFSPQLLASAVSKWAFLLTTLLLVGSAAAQGVQTSVCEIDQSPALFDGKMVRIRATVVSGFEVFGIRDPGNSECGLISLSYPGGGSAASLSISTKTPDLRREPVELRNDRQIKRFQQLLDAQMYPRVRGSICLGCARYQVTATLSGRLDYAGQGWGFGHMNHYPVQLVLESVSDVSAVDHASSYDPKEYSTAPVRFPTGYLKGRVVDPDGRPVMDAKVDIISTEDVPPYMHDFTDNTDNQGRFKIAVPPGSYLAGINLESPPSRAVPFPPTYYPGTTDEKTAMKLSVTDRQNVNGVVIRLPERLRERKVPVAVVWPDGKPANDANVWLSETGEPHSIVGGAVSHTFTDGMFDLIGFEGVDYFVHTNLYLKPRYTPYCAEVKTVKAGEPLPERLTMVLTITGEVCRGL